MRRLGLALVLFSIVFAAAAGSAAAAPVEERLSMDHTYGMDAVDGWVSWKNDGDRQKLWHSGGIVQLARPYSRVLGTDAEGQVVALESSCIGCRIVQRVLPD